MRKIKGIALIVLVGLLIISCSPGTGAGSTPVIPETSGETTPAAGEAAARPNRPEQPMELLRLPQKSSIFMAGQNIFPKLCWMVLPRNMALRFIMIPTHPMRS